MSDTSSMTITTDDGFILDRTVLGNALKPLAQYFIPKRRLRMRKQAVGRGGYGVVKLAELLSNDPATGGSIAVAVKVLQTDDSNAPPLRVAYRLAREMIAWSACKHENILPFIGYFLSGNLETAYLVSPFIRNGNVKHYLAGKEAKPEERLGLVRDTLQGLEYLHTRDPPIIHGDLKSLNVLVNDDRRAILCDFGLATAVREGHSDLTTSSDFKGSTRWCSPEVLMGDERTLKSDIWGWGCLALEIMTGNPPYYDIKNDTNVILAVCSGGSKQKTPEPTPTPTLPNGMLDLIRKCWYFEPDQRPDASTCLAAIGPVPQTETVRVWEKSWWLDNWIKEYIPVLKNAIKGCIHRAALDPEMARNLCQLSLLPTAKLQEELQDIETILERDENGQPLPSLTKRYLKLRKATITKEIEFRGQQIPGTAGFVRVRSSSTPGRRPNDPVGQILRAMSTLRNPVRLSREQIGETLREIHTLLKDEVAPLDPRRYLSSILPRFERLVRHYPDDFHPDVAWFLINVYYEHQVHRGNPALCLEVALAAAERYRELSRTDADFLSPLARTLEKVATSYEILRFPENARASLAEAISVYRQLNDTTGNQQAFQIPLARTLVRFYQVLCRLGRDWNDSDAVNALREALQIYDSRMGWGTSSQGVGLKQFGRDLADALVDLDLTLLRQGETVEALKVEDQLMNLYKMLGEEEQAEDVKKRRDWLSMMSSSASWPSAVA